MTIKLDPRKQRMMECLKKSMGNITLACESSGVSRQTHYDWLKDDENYKKANDDLPDIILDFLENALYKKVQAGDTTAIIYGLKSKGRKRDWQEKQEVDHSVTFNPVIEMERRLIEEPVIDISTTPPVASPDDPKSNDNPRSE